MSTQPRLGRETSFTALGQTWTAGRWSIRCWDELLEIARPHLGDPLAGLERLLPALAPEQQEKVLSEALRQKRRALSIGSPEVQEWLGTVEGQLALWYVLLKYPHHPDMTREQALELAAVIGEEEQSRIFAAASGQPPTAKNGMALVE